MQKIVRDTTPILTIDPTRVHEVIGPFVEKGSIGLGAFHGWFKKTPENKPELLSNSVSYDSPKIVDDLKDGISDIKQWMWKHYNFKSKERSDIAREYKDDARLYDNDYAAFFSVGNNQQSEVQLRQKYNTNDLLKMIDRVIIAKSKGLMSTENADRIIAKLNTARLIGPGAIDNIPAPKNK